MGDLFLNIGATALFNLVIQFALYPYLNKTLGKEMYGTALFMLSLVAIASGSCGTAANYSRLVSEKTLRPSNGDYNLFLLVGGILCAAVGLFLSLVDKASHPYNGNSFRGASHRHRFPLLFRCGV